MEILKGNKIVLRPMKPDEVRLIHKWANNPDVMPLWYGKKKTLKEIKDDWKPRYFSDKDPESGRCFVIELNCEPIGMINFNKINTKKNKVEIDIIIGAKNNWNKGYGTDALITLENYLFKNFNIQQIWVATDAKNERAIRAYKKAGFKIENNIDKEIILTLHR
jgi:RimJ/RimL family protein N-acetyltransferase